LKTDATIAAVDSFVGLDLLDGIYAYINVEDMLKNNCTLLFDV